MNTRLVATADWFNIRAIKASNNLETELQVDLIGPIGFKDWDNEGVTVTEFLSQLRTLPDAQTISLNIHSPGGIITEGLLMYNALANHPATINARIMGLCGSMATVIACAADKRTMAENAVWHMHEVQGGAIGSTSDMQSAAREMEFYQEMIAGIYAATTGKTKEEMLAQMKLDEPMNGLTAKQWGFIDEVTEDVNLSALRRFPMASTTSARFQKLPLAARVLFDTAAPSMSKPTALTLTGTADTPVVAPPAPGNDDTPVVAPAAPAADAPVEAGLVSRFIAGVRSLAGTDERITAMTASLSERDSTIAQLTARISALEPKALAHDALEASLKELEATQQTAAQRAAGIVASTGFNPETQSALPPPAAADTRSLIDQFNAITDPAERQAFFKANRAALRAA